MDTACQAYREYVAFAGAYEGEPNPPERPPEAALSLVEDHFRTCHKCAALMARYDGGSAALVAAAKTTQTVEAREAFVTAAEAQYAPTYQRGTRALRDRVPTQAPPERLARFLDAAEARFEGNFRSEPTDSSPPAPRSAWEIAQAWWQRATAWPATGQLGWALAALLLAVVGWQWLQAPVDPPADAGAQQTASTDSNAVFAAGTIVEATGQDEMLKDAPTADVRIADGGRMTVEEWTPDATRLRLDRGSLRADVRPRNSGQLFEVRTAYAVVRVVGTAFTVEHVPGSHTGVIGHHGKVAVTTLDGVELGYVTAGDTLTIDAPVVRGAEADSPAPSSAVASGRELARRDSEGLAVAERRDVAVDGPPKHAPSAPVVPAPSTEPGKTRIAASASREPRPTPQSPSRGPRGALRAAGKSRAAEARETTSESGSRPGVATGRDRPFAPSRDEARGEPVDATAERMPVAPEPVAPEPVAPEPVAAEPVAEPPAKGSAKAVNEREALSQVKALLAKGRSNDALQVLDSVATPSWRVDAARGEAYWVGNRPSKAATAYRRALERAPEAPESLLVDLIALLEGPLKRRKDALTLWNRYLKLYPNGRAAPTGRLALARGRLKSKNTRKSALKELRALVESHPRTNAAQEAYALVGRALVDGKKWTEAEAWFARSDRPPTKRAAETAAVGLIRVRIAQGRIDDARDRIDEYRASYAQGRRTSEVDRLESALP